MVPPGPLTIRTVRELDGVRELKETWRALQHNPRSDLDHYLSQVASRADFVRPHVMVLERDAVAVGLVVASVVRERIAFKIGSLVPWRSRARVLRVGAGGLLGVDCPATAQAVVAELRAALARGEAEAGYLHQIDSESPVLAALQNLPWPLRDGWARASAGWVLELPSTYEAYLASRGRNVRRNLRRYSALLESEIGDRSRIVCYRQPGDLERLVRDSETIARLTYHRGMGVGFRDTPELRAAFRFALEAGWLRAYLLYDGERPVAFWHGLAYAGTFFTRDTGYDPDLAALRPGHYLLNAIIAEHCRTRETERFDYGVMELEYKRHFGTRRYERVSPYLFARRPRGLWLATLRALTGVADRGARKLLGARARNLARRWATLGRSGPAPDGAENSGTRQERAAPAHEVGHPGAP
jgi:hypothetical protein